MESVAELTCDILIRPEKSLEPFFTALNKDWRCKVTPIPVDFIIFTDKDTPIAIERKTTWDFVGSIKGNHLIDQLRAMREVSDDAYILLEGSWAWVFSEKNKFKSHFNQSSIVGFIDAVDKFGVKIIPVNNKLWSILWLQKRLEDLKGLNKKTSFKLRSSASRDLSINEQAEYVISGFTGLGPSAIKEIRTSFKCAKDFLYWIIDPSDLIQNSTLSTRIDNLRPKWRSILESEWTL